MNGLGSETLRIVGGEPVRKTSGGENPFPYHVQLRIFNRDRTSSGLTCGGTIVHAWSRGFWVLTAAHCLDETQTYGVRYWVGSSEDVRSDSISQSGPSWADATRLLIFKHPLHQDTSNEYDVALIRCTLPPNRNLPSWMMRGDKIDFDKIPIINTQPTLSPARTVLIMGFGSTSNTQGLSSPTFMFTRGQVSDGDIRNADPAVFVNVFGENNSRACSGDSGGGCFDLNAPLPVILGPLCCTRTDFLRIECMNPSLYSRISQYMTSDSRFSRDVSGSPWSKGVKFIIDAYSPSGLRKQEDETQDSGDVGSLYVEDESGWDTGGSKASRNLFEELWLWLTDKASQPLLRVLGIVILVIIILVVVMSLTSRGKKRSRTITNL
jgi:hypothetical protein